MDVFTLLDGPRCIAGAGFSVPGGYDAYNGLSSFAAKTEVAAPASSGGVEKWPLHVRGRASRA